MSPSLWLVGDGIGRIVPEFEALLGGRPAADQPRVQSGNERTVFNRWSRLALFCGIVTYR